MALPGRSVVGFIVVESGNMAETRNEIFEQIDSNIAHHFVAIANNHWSQTIFFIANAHIAAMR